MNRLRIFRAARLIACRLAVCAGAFLLAMPAWAQSKVVLVEEHWELQIAEPGADSSAPQVSMVMSATGDSDNEFFVFNINHHSTPQYAPGGMQVQMWDSDGLVEDQSGYESGTLSLANEVITWVQRLTVDEGQLTFGIHNGSSETWGGFGGWDLQISTPTSLTGLNAYRPAVSLTESQVSYAENRVSSLVLKKLVWHTDDGQVFEQNAPIPLDTTLD
jgi:hypothetical protein